MYLMTRHSPRVFHARDSLRDVTTATPRNLPQIPFTDAETLDAQGFPENESFPHLGKSMEILGFSGFIGHLTCGASSVEFPAALGALSCLDLGPQQPQKNF
jgi:hypothetical protein